MEEHVVIEVRLLGQCLVDPHLAGEDVADVQDQLDHGRAGLLGGVKTLETPNGLQDNA